MKLDSKPDHPSSEPSSLTISYTMQWKSFTINSINIPDLLSESKSVSHSVVPDSLQPHGLQPTRLLCPWDFLGKDTGIVCHFLLQRIFPTQGSNWVLLHCRKILYRLNEQGRLTSLGLRSNNSYKVAKSTDPGLPWWSSGWESALQFRGHGFDPWLGS